MSRRIATPQALINNNVIAIVPNTFVYTEGLGEQIVAVASTGGGGTQITTSNNVETNKSKVMFDVFSTKENIDFFRGVKSNSGLNVFQVSDPDSDFARTITNATIINDYEINLGAEGNISIEIEGSKSI